MNLMHTGTLQVEDQKLCVLYDPSSGAIVHTHWVTTLAGGRKVDAKEVEKRARERAALRGGDVSATKALHVDPKTYHAGSHYKVDVKAGQLIAVAKPGKKRKA